MVYSVPQPAGGKLIRQVMATLKSEKLKLPLERKLILAVSGGADSLALAQLLVKYGRKISAPAHIEILHINHGWRGKKSDRDERKVVLFAKKHGVPIHVVRLSQGHLVKGESPENAARKERKKIYQKLAEEKNAWILTGHQADEVAETLIWRFFTGAFNDSQEGIRVTEGVELRPLINCRKADLSAFLEEEKIRPNFDATNFDKKYLRGQMRSELLPVIQRIFPNALGQLARRAQEIRERKVSLEPEKHGQDHLKNLMKWLSEDQGLRLNRTHLVGDRSLDLPGGWKIRVESKLSASSQKPIRWILEKS